MSSLWGRTASLVESALSCVTSQGCTDTRVEQPACVVLSVSGRRGTVGKAEKDMQGPGTSSSCWSVCVAPPFPCNAPPPPQVECVVLQLHELASSCPGAKRGGRTQLREGENAAAALKAEGPRCSLLVSALSRPDLAGLGAGWQSFTDVCKYLTSKEKGASIRRYPFHCGNCTLFLSGMHSPWVGKGRKNGLRRKSPHTLRAPPGVLCWVYDCPQVGMLWGQNSHCC